MRPRRVLSEDTQTGIADYINDLFVDEWPSQARIRETTAEAGLPEIDVRPEEGYTLMFLARLIQAKRIVEVGTLAGYSSTWLARGLAEGGKVSTLELEEKHAAVARANFEATGLADRIEVLVGDGHQTLAGLDETVDMFFIDAEKEGYSQYLDWGLAHVRPGGIIIAHNAIRSGKIVHPEPDDTATEAIMAFNARLAQETFSTLLQGGDGFAIGIVTP